MTAASLLDQERAARRRVEAALKPLAAVGAEWRRCLLNADDPVLGLDKTLIYGEHGSDGPQISVTDALAAHDALTEEQ